MAASKTAQVSMAVSEQRQLLPSAQLNVSTTKTIQEAPAPTSGKYGQVQGREFVISKDAWASQDEIQFELTKPKVSDMTAFGISSKNIRPHGESFYGAAYNVVRDGQTTTALTVRGVLICANGSGRGPSQARSYGVDYARFVVFPELIKKIVTALDKLGVKVADPPIDKSSVADDMVVFTANTAKCAMGTVEANSDGDGAVLVQRNLSGPLASDTDFLCNVAFVVETRYKGPTPSSWDRGVHHLVLKPVIVGITIHSDDEPVAPVPPTGGPRTTSKFDATDVTKETTLQTYFMGA